MCVDVCLDVRLILVSVLGRQIVYGQNTVYLCLSKYIVFLNTHTHIATVASETEGVAAVSCMESHMNRRPLGSIDPNSIRETELHTECRRRRDRSPYTARSMTGRGMLLVRGRRAAARLRAAAARQAAREADRARRTSEAAVKRSDLSAFLRVFVFCSFTSNRLVGDTYVALVDG